MTAPNVGMNEDGPSRRPLPGSRESHDGTPVWTGGGTDGRKPASNASIAAVSVSAVASLRVRSLTGKLGRMAWRSVQFTVAVGCTTTC